MQAPTFYCNYVLFVEELAVSVSDQSRIVSEVAAGANNTDYLDLAKKGGGHRGNNFTVLTGIRLTARG